MPKEFIKHYKHHLQNEHRELDAQKDSLQKIYLVHLCRGLVFSLFGFFIPVYLAQIFDIKTVLIFYLFEQFFLLLFCFLSVPLTNKIGLKHTILISLPLTIAYSITLSMLSTFSNLYLLYFSSILLAAQTTFYWTPFQILFALKSKPKSQYKDTQNLFSIQKTYALIAPLIGGFVSLKFGFESLFILASIILLIPIIIILKSKDIKTHNRLEKKYFISIAKKNKRLLYWISGETLGEVSEGVIWPLFIIISITNPVKIGFLSTLLGLGSIIFIYLAGSIAKKTQGSMIIKTASILLCLAWLARYFSNSTSFIFISTIVVGFAFVMFSIHTNANLIRVSKKKSSQELIIVKEVPIIISRVIIITIALLLLPSIEKVFLATSFGFLLMLFL